MDKRIQKAIGQSTSFDRRGIANVEVSDGQDIFDVLSGVDYEGMGREIDGSYDVWGTGPYGEEWRIRVTLVVA